MQIQVPDWLKTYDGPFVSVPGLEYKNDTSKIVYIYGLIDPETLDLRYIGKSIRPLERLQNHMNERSNCHRSHWLQSLKARGLKPEMVIIEEIHGAWPWQESERYWIALARKLGAPLTNNTDGGDGVEGLPAETRKRMAAVWKGRKHKPETVEKFRLINTNRKASPETRAKMSAAQKGRLITWGDKLSEANRKISQENVPVILARLAAGEKVKDLADEFGVHRTTMSKIKKGVYR